MVNTDKPGLPNRRSIRLQNYDYTQAGAYYLTICTAARMSLFGRIVDGVMQLNDYGRVVEEEWLQTGNLRANVDLDAFIVMPNHFHAVLLIVDMPPQRINETDQGMSAPCPYDLQTPTNKRQFGKPIAGSLPTIVGAFKSAVARKITRTLGISSHSIWQRNYHEHIIRNRTELDRIREYIEYNRVNWEHDKNNPTNW
jgi:putative transposase